MGWLERIERAVRTEVATTRSRPLIGRVAGPPAPAEQRFGLSQLMEMFSFQGVGYSVYGGDNNNRERDTTSFTRYVGEFYRDNGVIFAVILSRMLLFTEAKFQWQRLVNGRPGDLFGTGALSLLETPWPNGTTGDLLARMEQDVSLHGNFYATREGDRIRRLRPDWVEIILDAAPGEAVATNIVGYLYKPGGTDSSTAPKVFTPQEIAHWAPIPDPLAQYRGMSWLTPVIREMVADRAATDHKLKFFENAATPNLAVSFSENITKDQFNAFMAAMNAAHQGTANAYKTLYLGGGADVKTIGANMEQMDFKNTQGAGETRICAAGGVPPIIVGLSEGLASATYSNYGMARRKFGDHWARPQWRSACAALSVLLDVPSGARLWYDDRDIAFLREDQKDVASIQSQQATTMKSLVDSGYEPDSVTAAMLNEDWSLLKHTGLFSVQLQPPGTVQKAGAIAAGAGPVAGLPAGGSGPNDTTPAKTATGGQPTPAAGGTSGSGTATPAKPATPSQPSSTAPSGSSATPATPARDTDELAELREQVASLTGLVADLVAERGGWDEASHPREPSGKFAEVPGLDLVASKGKRKGISHNTITAKIWGEKAGHIRLTGEGTEIDDLAVSPKHRGKGIAHKLMQEAIRQHGDKVMRLHASPFGKGGLDAEGLMAFYAKHGFVPEPDRGKGYMVRHPSGGRSADLDDEARTWDEALHPRAPEGSASGGQFMAYDKSKNQGTGYGKKGGDANVRELQEALNKLGFTDAKGNKLAVDGQLGPLTTAAIMKAQKALGVKADGKVDKALLDKIKAMHEPTAHEDHSKAKPGSHKPIAHEDHGKAKPHGPSAHQDVKGPGDGKFHNAPAHKAKPKHKAGPVAQVDHGKAKPKPPAKKKPAKPEPPHYQHVSVQPGGRDGWPEQADERANWSDSQHPRGPDGKFAHLSSAQLAHELGKVNYQLNDPKNQIAAMQQVLQAKHKAIKTELNARPDKPAKIPEWTPGTKFSPPKTAAPTPAAPKPAAPTHGGTQLDADKLNLTKDQQRAVREYSGGRYRDINHTLRGKDWSYSDTQELTDGLDGAFEHARTTEPMTVRRRLKNATELFGQPGERVGKTFVDPGFTSTTEHDEGGAFFGQDELEIKLPADTPALRLGSLSMNPNEKEILLRRGTRFKVVSDEATPKGRRIALEVQL